MSGATATVPPMMIQVSIGAGNVARHDGERWEVKDERLRIVGAAGRQVAEYAAGSWTSVRMSPAAPADEG